MNGVVGSPCAVHGNQRFANGLQGVGVNAVEPCRDTVYLGALAHGEDAHKGASAANEGDSVCAGLNPLGDFHAVDDDVGLGQGGRVFGQFANRPILLPVEVIVPLLQSADIETAEGRNFGVEWRGRAPHCW